MKHSDVLEIIYCCNIFNGRGGIAEEAEKKYSDLKLLVEMVDYFILALNHTPFVANIKREAEYFETFLENTSRSSEDSIVLHGLKEHLKHHVRQINAEFIKLFKQAAIENIYARQCKSHFQVSCIGVESINVMYCRTYPSPFFEAKLEKTSGLEKAEMEGRNQILRFSNMEYVEILVQRDRVLNPRSNSGRINLSGVKFVAKL